MTLPEPWVLADLHYSEERPMSESQREPTPVLYFCRCGWCGAYEGTVDPGEACAQDPATGEYIGPHQFGVYERVYAPVEAPTEPSLLQESDDDVPF